MTEADRQRDLDGYGLLDTPPEAAFDAIVALAARRFDAPVAAISLIDRDRQWFKARHGLALGLDVAQTERDVAFCDRVVRTGCPLVIGDATSHPRFALNPLVIGPPYIYFYAGAPLLTPRGHALGALCVMDSNPRPPFTAADLDDLQTAARLAVDQMEIRLARARGGRLCPPLAA